MSKHEKWLENAEDTLKDLNNIDPEKATRDQYLLYGASLAVLDHFEREGETVCLESESAVQGENEGSQGILMDYMNDELQDAEKYYKLWLETQAPEYQEMAADELRHFEYLVRIVHMNDPVFDVGNFKVWHDALMAKIGTIDYVPGSRIDELKQESLQHFTSYMQNKSLEQLHRSEHHGSVACDCLRKMLKVDEEIANDLYRAADEEEREHIKESYKKVLEDMK